MLRVQTQEINPHNVTIRSRTEFLKLMDSFGIEVEILEENKQLWYEWNEEEISPKEIVLSVRNLSD